MEVKAYKSIDKVTGQVIYYVRELGITAYGATDEKAQEMLRTTMLEMGKNMASKITVNGLGFTN